MYVIYQHIRKSDNIVFYIGIGNKQRPYKKANRSNFWTKEVNKHEYIIEILSDNLNWENAQEAEIQLIKLYGRRDLGLGTLVNLTDGGDGAPGCKPSQETKDKLSKALKGKNLGKPSKLKGTKLKLEHIKYGKDNPFYGNTMFRGSGSPCAKKVICTESGMIWNCIQDCADENNIKKTTLTAWLNGQNKNKSTFRYL